MPNKYIIKKVVRDEKEVLKLRCPKCEKWGDIDNEQYHGQISILCDCGYHETLDLSKLPIE